MKILFELKNKLIFGLYDNFFQNDPYLTNIFQIVRSGPEVFLNKKYFSDIEIETS